MLREVVKEENIFLVMSGSSSACKAATSVPAIV
jgi:hypothetical protein